MKRLFVLFLFGCNVAAQNNQEIQKEAEFNKLMQNVNQTHQNSNKVQELAAKKETELVTKAVSTIITMKSEIKDLKNEISEAKNRIDTIIIHDTVLIKEKKNFWGKTKSDTTSKL